MQSLAQRTSPEWVRLVEREPLALLSDHAHCELRAAASAQAMIVNNPGRTEFARRMTTVALEELEHFRAVLDELERRGGRLDHKAPSPYAQGLVAGSLEGRGDPFLDRLLIAALIELRSLERFGLLAEHAADPALRGLYGSLVASERAHARMFVDLALEFFPADVVHARRAALVALEGRVVAGLPFAPRMHSGLAGVPVA